MQRELDLEKDIVEDLLSVAGADIVVVADDSGSMSCVANPGNYQNPMTRWDELRETLIKLAHMLLVVDHSDGFNVQFLNDPTWHEIHSKEQVESLFVGRSPRGTTPLGARLAPLLDGSWHPKGHGAETDLILIVMTDGSPSDVDFGGLTRLVAGKKANVYVTFMIVHGGRRRRRRLQPPPRPHPRRRHHRRLRVGEEGGRGPRPQALLLQVAREGDARRQARQVRQDGRARRRLLRRRVVRK